MLSRWCGRRRGRRPGSRGPSRSSPRWGTCSLGAPACAFSSCAGTCTCAGNGTSCGCRSIFCIRTCTCGPSPRCHQQQQYLHPAVPRLLLLWARCAGVCRREWVPPQRLDRRPGCWRARHTRGAFPVRMRNTGGVSWKVGRCRTWKLFWNIGRCLEGRKGCASSVIEGDGWTVERC